MAAAQTVRSFYHEKSSEGAFLVSGHNGVIMIRIYCTNVNEGDKN
jgi:hypothetical protein